MTTPIVFFGSPQFAVPALRSLSQDPRFTIELVVTQPDRPSGRGRRTVAPPVKVEAQDLGLSVWQPESLKAPDTVDRLRSVDAEVFVVAAYGEIFRRAVLDLPPHGCLNIHPSLLPAYRGSSPVQAAILNGDRETGVSIIRLVRRLDAGPIVAQQRMSLTGRETAGELSRRLAEDAAAMLPDVVARWVDGEIEAVPQDENQASYTRELRKEDGKVDWRRPAPEIERLVRAMDPWPRAWSLLRGARLSLLDVEVIEQAGSALPFGSITIAPAGIDVATGGGTIRLLRVQPEGRREMSAADWARGARLGDDARFDMDGPDQHVED